MPRNQLPDPSLAGGTNTLTLDNNALGGNSFLSGGGGGGNNSLGDPLGSMSSSANHTSLGSQSTFDLSQIAQSSTGGNPSMNGVTGWSAVAGSRGGANTIAQVLLQEGLVDQAKYDEANRESLSSSKSIEQILLDKGYVKSADVTKAKGIMYGIPYIDLTSVDITNEANKGLDEELAKRVKIIIIQRHGDQCSAAMANPLDIQSIRLVEQRLGVRLKIYIADEDTLMMKISSKLGGNMNAEVSNLVDQAVTDSDIVDLTNEDTSLEGVNIATAPIAKIINGILQNAASTKASDVHIEPMDDRIRVRFRTNGILQEVSSFPLQLLSSLVSRIKILAKLAIDEKRKAQDGRFQIRYNDQDIDLRISTLPTVYGEKCVIRLLRRDLGIISLEDTGMRGSTLKLFMEGLKVTSGIILITGPTGSGKTVTVATSMQILNKPEVNVVSIEDPVEIRVAGVNQVQVNNEAGLTFASALRAFLRQDPNIISVGEIRDGETAALAAQASLTGHLVISTLHTNSAAGVLPRLMDMGIEPYILASAVHMCTAQRLTRRICSCCKFAYPIRDFEDAELRNEMAVLGNVDFASFIASQKKFLENISIMDSEGNQNLEYKEGQLYLFRGKGCNQCYGTGYSGRIGIFEAFKVTEKIGSKIMHSATADEIQKIAISEGMITMVLDGYFKALEGLTTLEEVQRVIKS